ncbi:stalk domain-containing protein [Paenibacillus hamazuiensis]|uniref:stalk domain-containing protein n=1 Tax=Paenibacillus hamazuiensis TaxID=2936508 RepID=UPI00200F20A9|nr:stalk domain-containing protein [Paenibacillus hamazuiensis]
MKKSITAVIAAAAFILSTPTVTKADEAIPVFINGEKISFEVQPFIEEGTTMVPFRPVFENLGLTVSWDGETQTVKGTRNNLTIELQIGSTTAKLNSATENLALAPKIVNGNTFVPLRFIGEAADKYVVWDEKKHSIFLRDDVATYMQNTLYYTDKQVTYVGDMKDGQRNGRGTLYADKKLVFEGEFKDNRINGTGTLYWQGGQKLYEGQWSKGFMNGSGKLYKEDGRLWYDGITMVDNSIQGTGTFYYNNGAFYKGELVDGIGSGQGKFFNENGKLVYEGQFKEGLFEGKGKMFYADGNLKFEGEFHEDEASGMGKQYSPSGVITYEGYFKNGIRNGQGTLYNSDGTVKFKGMFKDGKPVPDSK